VESIHKGLPASMKFMTAPFTGKVMLTDFWDVNGIVHSDFMPTGSTVKAEHSLER
jgi:hypothetical protein